MNFQYMLLNNKKFTNDRKLNKELADIAEEISINKIKFTEKKFVYNEMCYYHNALPIIPESRDVLKKPISICNMRVNWKKEKFEGLSPDEISTKLKLQYGFCITIVDKEHTRNNFKNKECVWVVFDSEKIALKNLYTFNKMFRTAIEQNCIDEYKKFKQNPMKRPLTYDKLVENAYELYARVDRGEL